MPVKFMLDRKYKNSNNDHKKDSLYRKLEFIEKKIDGITSKLNKFLYSK